MLPPNTEYRGSEALGPPIPIPVSKGAQELPVEIMKSREWVISRPVMPAPEIWELLKGARTTEHIRKASREMSRWMATEYGPGVGRWLPGSPPLELPDALELYSGQLLLGKRLPSYAKTKRPKSDDKRVVFLSKVLAGARFGLAPITATKRLSHWDWPKDWDERKMKEFLDLSKAEFAKSKKQKVGTITGPIEVLSMATRRPAPRP